eukprot:scaffold542947_cov31-Prasinocladus_malaysianus.AAC.1
MCMPCHKHHGNPDIPPLPVKSQGTLHCRCLEVVQCLGTVRQAGEWIAVRAYRPACVETCGEDALQLAAGSNLRSDGLVEWEQTKRLCSLSIVVDPVAISSRRQYICFVDEFH